MRYSRGKWTKHKTLIKEDELIPFFPETKLLDKDSFWEIMNQYDQVIVKPNLGRLGKGISLIKKINTNKYVFRSEMSKAIISEDEKLYDYLQRYLKNKKYIVQQAISLAEINNKPFDIRIMVQRRSSSPTWIITGMVAKIAPKKYFVTNGASKVMYVADAIKASNINSDICEFVIIQTLEKISLLTAETLSKIYPKQRVFGLDVGLDINGKPWIFEANCSPSLAFFKLLKDQEMLKKMRFYKKKE